MLGRHGEIEELVGAHAPAVIYRLQMRLRGHVGVFLLKGATLIGELCAELLHAREVIIRIGLGDDTAHVLSEVRVTPVTPRKADHMELVGQEPTGVQVVQRRDDLSRHQVSGGAEHGENRGDIGFHVPRTTFRCDLLRERGQYL